MVHDEFIRISRILTATGLPPQRQHGQVERLELELEEGLNFFTGSNGSGKS